MLSAREIKPPPVLTTYPLNSIILAYSSNCASKTKIFFVLKNSLCLSRGGGSKTLLVLYTKRCLVVQVTPPQFCEVNKSYPGHGTMYLASWSYRVGFINFDVHHTTYAIGLAQNGKSTSFIHKDTTSGLVVQVTPRVLN